MKKIGLHIFRRDLRLEDNTALINNLDKNEETIPCFIFTPSQIKNNEYKSDNALQFLIESLMILDENLKKKGSKLYIFYGNTVDVLSDISDQTNISNITFNRDYTPFARERDAKIQEFCKKRNVMCSVYADALINEPEDVHKDDGKPYTVFTYFRKKAEIISVANPQENIFDNYYKGEMLGTVADVFFDEISSQKNEKMPIKGGENEAKKLLLNFSMKKRYSDQRDFPAENITSYLSAHHKFGTISIREVFHTIRKSRGAGNTFLHELYWRDFFTHIAWHFPFIFKQSFSPKFRNIPWDNNEEFFEAWKKGRTGFPIVDAGMRELNETGFMHNRVRMIVASFLVKDLRINWQWGEKYFAQKLVDYDPAVNNGNWQWASSTGCDAQPYFRIFNPWRQSIRFDKEVKYIHKWVPETRNLTAKEIHNLFKERPLMIDKKYPLPIIDHSVESKKTKDLFKKIAEDFKVNNS